jgi:glycosyltransferase involved in cell wall biosynthesis
MDPAKEPGAVKTAEIRTGRKRTIVLVTSIPETIFSTMEELIPFLVRKNFNVVAMGSKGQWLSPEDVKRKFTIPYYTINFTRIFSPLRDILALFGVLKTLLLLRPDVIHYSTPKAALLTSIAAYVARVPTRTYTIRGMTYVGKKGPAFFLSIMIERLTCLLSQSVLCVSASNLSYCASKKICSPEKISILGSGSSHGVDAEKKFNRALLLKDKLVDMKKKLGIPAGAVVFGFVGRLVRDKGAEELLSAWDKFSQKHADAFLLIIGDNQEPRDRVHAHAISGKTANERLRVIRPTTDIAAYYGIMDVVVLPSHREGFPNVVLEAGAMELPVITTNAIGCRDSVVDGKTGLVFQCGNKDELLEKMELLYADERLRRS